MFSRLTNGTENGSLLSRSEYGAATTSYAAVCWEKSLMFYLYVFFCNVCYASERWRLWTLYCKQFVFRNGFDIVCSCALAFNFDSVPSQNFEFENTFIVYFLPVRS